MTKIPVKMILGKDDKYMLEEFIGKYRAPEGFKVRSFRLGEEALWAQIETGAGEFATEEAAISHFQKEFGLFGEELQKFCFFIEDSLANRPVGTAMAWFGRYLNDTYMGRLHWVGIHRDYQGKKLAKPLLATVGKVLYRNYESAYLTSQTTSYKAINIYLEMGFKPVIDSNESEKAWIMMEEILDKKIICGG